MAFKRSNTLSPRPAASNLTAAFVGIGMNFATTTAKASSAPPIEETLVYASELGMNEGDLRVLSILTTWLSVHHPGVNADRLNRLLCEHPSARVRAYWASIAHWLAKERRFARLAKLYNGPTLDLLPTGTDFQLARHGEDPRFAGSTLRVPRGTLRDRPADVLSRSRLAEIHPGYRNRIIIGPSWRADVWTLTNAEPQLSTAEIARQVGCAFATAWQTIEDARLLR